MKQVHVSLDRVGAGQSLLTLAASFLKIENAIVFGNENNYILSRIHQFRFGHFPKVVFPFGANVEPGPGLSDMRRLEIRRRKRRITLQRHFPLALVADFR